MPLPATEGKTRGTQEEHKRAHPNFLACGWLAGGFGVACRSQLPPKRLVWPAPRLNRHGLAVSIQLPWGTAPASGAPTRRPRRVGQTCAELLNGVPSRPSPRVAGEGASHGARGGRDPLLPHRHGLAFAFSVAAAAGSSSPATESASSEVTATAALKEAAAAPFLEQRNLQLWLMCLRHLSYPNTY